MSTPAAIITGASSGIGRATAIALAGAGWSVVLVARRRDELERTAEAMDLRPDAQVLCLVADLLEEGSAATVADATIAAMGRIDALVSVAGWAELVPLPEVTREHAERTMRVNAIAPLQLVSCCWDALAEADPGRVVVFSSMSGRDPYPGLSAYGMAKSAAQGLVRSIHNESNGRILAVGVGPGAVETPMLRSLLTVQQVPPEMCMDPGEPARLVVEILQGRRDACSGRTVYMPRSGELLGHD